MFRLIKRKGFTIIELLVVLVIISIILLAILRLFQFILNSFDKEYKKLVSQLEFISAIELLRVDLNHAGYGIAKDLNINVFDWNSSNKILTIRSSINITNRKTRGWLLIDCRNSKFKVEIDNREEKLSNQDLIFTDINKNFIANGKYGKCPDFSIMIAFPVDKNHTFCNGQYCYEIKYKFVKPKSKTCKNGNYRLIRSVNKSNGETVINCIKNPHVNIDHTNKKIYISMDVLETEDKNNPIWQTVKLVVKPINW
ncbi:MAG TPA: prepilin-type N-terminal cleavage/methylation domain-containing protein [Persephonella sp.]|nr:prepilin-type N-terminal cleavage/methylation domain-containing protein [Hydrogenothermaceae bacterium]HIQ25433.1 prepilin-type N-terminal cleavage/methylation domain-containing protein [Persephonella sp.]